MEKILDFTSELDVSAFEQVVNDFYNGSRLARQQAQDILTRFQEHPDSWQRVDRVLQYGQRMESKFLALSVLNKLVNTRWRSLPEEQKMGIRNFVIGMVLTMCQNSDSYNRSLIEKADVLIVQMFKQDSMTKWPTFIDELIQSAQHSLSICANNLNILRILSEEVFDYHDRITGITKARLMKLKVYLVVEFERIGEFLSNILRTSSNADLISSTLECLLRYLKWIPIKHIFKTDLVELLSRRFLISDRTKSITLKCLTEVADLTIYDDAEDSMLLKNKTVNFFESILAQISDNVISLTLDLNEAYSKADSSNQNFLQDFTIFVSTFLTRHRVYLQSDISLRPLLNKSHKYLIQLTKIDEKELLKACLEYWNQLFSSVFLDDQNMSMKTFHVSNGNINTIKSLYEEIASQLRWIIVDSMMKPRDIILSINDEGELEQEGTVDTESLSTYKLQREVLMYLTLLDSLDTTNIISCKLRNLINNNADWSWSQLNKTCWAVGSISGTMNEATELKFLEEVISQLCQINDMKRLNGQDDEIVAVNMMYVITQYPRILKNNCKILDLTLSKVFEYMKYPNGNVKHMACETFLAISESCGQALATSYETAVPPMIENLCNEIKNLTSNLAPTEITMFYEGTARIISFVHDSDQKLKLIEKLMELPNLAWDEILKQFQLNNSNILNIELARVSINIIKTNTAICKSLASNMTKQFERVFFNSMDMYQVASDYILSKVTTSNNLEINTLEIRTLKTLRREILRLVEEYISKTNCMDNLIFSIKDCLLKTILPSYSSSVAGAREVEVLICLHTLIDRMGNLIKDDIKVVFCSIFDCTLEMITADFVAYPDHRYHFYALLKIITIRSFDNIQSLPHETFGLYMSSIYWSMKHNNRPIEIFGLEIALEITRNLKKVSNNEFCVMFYMNHYQTLINETFAVLTEGDHDAGFSRQALLLSELIGLEEENKINIRFVAEEDNRTYLFNYLFSMLSSVFPHMKEDQIQSFLNVLFSSYRIIEKFTSTLADFLVQINEIGGDPSDYLFDINEQQLFEKNLDLNRKEEHLETKFLRDLDD